MQSTAQAVVPNTPDLSGMQAEAVTALSAQADEIRRIVKANKTKNLTEQVKDEVYVDLQTKHKAFVAELQVAPLMFGISRDQGKFLENVLTSQLSYGVNDIFMAEKVMGEFISEVLLAPSKSNREVNQHEIKAETMVVLYHLLAQHKVKGLGTTAVHFANVLRAIGKMSVTFNHFEAESKRLHSEIMDWVQFVTPDPEGEAMVAEAQARVAAETAEQKQ